MQKKVISLISIMLSFTIEAEHIDKILTKIKNEIKCTIEITSGYRSKSHNKKVGGAVNSYHLKNRARDFIIKSGKCSLIEVSKVACKYATTIRYKHHIHIDNRSNKKCFTGVYKNKTGNTNHNSIIKEFE